jgi:hypothetical protein
MDWIWLGAPSSVNENESAVGEIAIDGGLGAICAVTATVYGEPGTPLWDVWTTIDAA